METIVQRMTGIDMIESILKRRLERVHTVEDLAAHLEQFLNSGCDVGTDEQTGEQTLIETRALVEHTHGLAIHIYPREHPPPHFHVTGPGQNITFSILDCSLLNGSADGKTRRLITFWYRSARAKLIKIWNETRPTDCPVGSIRDEV